MSLFWIVTRTTLACTFLFPTAFMFSSGIYSPVKTRDMISGKCQRYVRFVKAQQAIEGVDDVACTEAQYRDADIDVFHRRLEQD